MRIYCSCCDKVQPVRIDNCRDAKTNEPFQDIVCAECDLVIASGTGIAPSAQRKPLTMQERTSIVRANTSFHDKNEIDAYGIIDDVEAAHGIKGDA